MKNLFKGFGEQPKKIELVRLKNTSREEMDRAMRDYLRQGASKEKALEYVASSVMYCEANKAGMVEGTDYSFGDSGIYVSPRMTEWLKSHTGQQHWEHMEMEGFITKASAPSEPDVALTTAGFVRLTLLSAKDVDDPNIDHKGAQAACIQFLEMIDFSTVEAEAKLQRYLDGEESLEELLELIEAGFQKIREEE